MDANLRKAHPSLESSTHLEMSIGGFVGERIKQNEQNWLRTTRLSNPAIIDMFHDRDRTPTRDLLPWSGEFAGKYLTSLVECYRLSRTKELKTTIKNFVKELIESQADDGYMGPFPARRRMFGQDTWDLWGQYHCMLGLLKWHQESGDPDALAACKRTADFFCKTFLDGNKRVREAGSEEMNESCIHVFTLLYQQTGETRYLRLAEEIVKDFETPPSGDYVRAALAGKPFFQMPKPRWEGLHAVQALAEMYFISGDDRYRKAFEQIWWTIAEFDRHNTGGFSSGEQAQGNPYDPRPIETCCTVAWMAISIDMLRLTGDSKVADELELSTFNGILGAQEANGRWWTYNTPMDGERKAATQDIDFQERPGSPELSCCSVNGPRGLGMLSDWAVMRNAAGINLNFYGPSSITIPSPTGSPVKLVQKTRYPTDGHILVSLEPTRPEQFALRLRIPGWSAKTRVTVNGQTVADVVPGTYHSIKRLWSPGDKVDIVLDMSNWFWVGERESAGKVSVYSGPILLAYDPRYDSYDPGKLPIADWGRPLVETPKWTREPKPWILKRFPTRDGHSVTLCDFATAGMAGNRYVSWLPTSATTASPFSHRNPMRTVRK